MGPDTFYRIEQDDLIWTGYFLKMIDNDEDERMMMIMMMMMMMMMIFESEQSKSRKWPKTSKKLQNPDF